MPKLPVWTAKEAKAKLLEAGFLLIRTHGSHAIFMKGDRRCVLPMHAGQTLHPKIIKQVIRTIDEVS